MYLYNLRTYDIPERKLALTHCPMTMCELFSVNTMCKSMLGLRFFKASFGEGSLASCEPPVRFEPRTPNQGG